MSSYKNKIKQAAKNNQTISFLFWILGAKLLQAAQIAGKIAFVELRC